MRPCKPSGLGCALLAVLAFGPGYVLASEKPADAAAVEHFEKKVRPLLVQHCHKCHSAATKARGKLLLDSRAALIKGGETGPAILAGAPEKSLLLKAVSYKHDLRMPPRSKLSDEQIADLTVWVKAGAPWPGGDRTTAAVETFDFDRRIRHWSFQPVRRGVPPAVKGHAWPRGPIDRFLLARLEAASLAPAPEADRRTLLRRVTFDLTGLPPTPEEVEAFVADRRPDAYERVVDRLLASPAYGERWGRHWLDLVRFSQTSGHEFDFEIPQAAGYRDYVLRAFNDDVPYDRLVREHIAGDLMASPRRHPADRTNESILGTGFWFLGESKHSPVDLRVDGGDRRDNMVDVFSKAFLGLTVSCARCHDHKFDPIYTKDYYSLVSFVQSSRMQLAFLDPPDRIARPAGDVLKLRREAAALAREQSAAALESGLAGLAEALLGARKDSTSAVAAALKKVDARRPAGLFAAWKALGEPALAPAAFEARRQEWLKGAAGKDRGTTFEDFAQADFRGWFVTGDAFGRGPAGADDLVIDPDHALPARRHQQGASSGRASARLQGALRSKTFPIEAKFIHYRARGRAVRLNLIIDGFQQIRAPIYGGLTFVVGADQPRWYSQDVSMWVGQKAYIEVLDDGDGHIELERVVFSDHPPPAERALAPVADLVERSRSAEDLAKGYQKLLLGAAKSWGEGKLPADRRDLIDAALQDAVVAALLPRGGARPALAAKMKEVRALESALPAPRRGLALADGSAVLERVHIRGNPKTLGEEAPLRLPVALGGDRHPLPREGSGRLEMARRLTSADSPLFARVLVNRLWHHHFGAGLVRTVDDFGRQGERPTHPELLDWLAGELARGGWSLKHMHRLMVTSSAYRMASRGGEAAEAADPRNELLHRMPIRRLEAEAIRDAMLAVSGRLDRRMFGKGPLPHLTPFMVGRGRPGSGPLDGDGRRSVYLQVRRNFLNPMFLAFDYPTPFTTIGRRSVSNVPAQALTLLNNPFVIQQAKRWGEEVAARPGDDAAKVAAMYEEAFGRPPTAEEREEALAFVRESGAGAWGDLAHVLFNVKEFVFVN